MNRIEELVMLIYGTIKLIKQKCDSFAMINNEKFAKDFFNKTISLNKYIKEYNELIKLK